jgi:hypothetical protein
MTMRPSVAKNVRLIKFTGITFGICLRGVGMCNFISTSKNGNSISYSERGPQCGLMERTGPIKCVTLVISLPLTQTMVQGEVDILEGVNDHGPDQVTLHTNAGR